LYDANNPDPRHKAILYKFIDLDKDERSQSILDHFL
jgi:hypothetical protein